MIKCNGFYETCECEDCKRVTQLYEELEYYQDDREDFAYEIAELEQQILAMGYWLN